MPQPLSDKAKGKQRAVDAVPVPPATRQLVIRFTDGIPDLELTLGKDESVRGLKFSIRTKRPQLERRRLKLIHAGRLLTAEIKPFEWLQSLEDRQRRASARDEAASASAASSTGEDIQTTTAPAPSTTLPTAYLHCSVGPELEAEEAEDGEDGQVRLQSTQIRPLRGFDRLAGAGFSEADIANFRRQFHAGAADSLALAEFATEEEYEEYARTLEEQWIESIDNSGIGSPSTDSNAVLQGVLLGFFMPFLPFFYFASPKLPIFWSSGESVETLGSVIFSRRMQMGLVVGFAINVLLGLWRYLWGSL
ncbi:hypothetical protein PENSPDRAFT_589123 [Peniophora sp. CONT]|nr:hypothetical protein PENSPDRAFT_589123 [Peniophora sp. CONT]